MIKGVAFDMDGTLTKPKIDFAGLRKKLGLVDESRPLFELIMELDEPERSKALSALEQAEIMAGILGEKWSLPVAKKALLRVKETAPQSFLSSNLRQKNIRGAFKVNDQWRRYVPKFPVLLVDDIWTTGATMRTAANVLKRAGIPQVWGLTFCR